MRSASSRSPASWAAPRPRCRTRRATSTSRPRSGGPKRSPGARAAIHFSTDAGHRFERGVDPATTVEHIERLTSLIVEICGGAETRCGPIDDQSPRLPELAPVTLRVARAAKVIGMPVTQADCEGVMARLGFASTSRPGDDRRRAAELALRPPDRGRPDRGSDPPDRLRRLARPGRRAARCSAKVASESRRGASALRHAMADLGWQETINFSFVDERWERDFAGNADADPRRQSDRRVALGDALEPRRQPGRGAARQPRAQGVARARVRARQGVRSRPGQRRRARSASPACASRSSSAASPSARSRRRNGACAERQRRLLRRQGRRRGAARAGASRASSLRRIRRCIPGRSAAIELDGERIGFIGELHPRWRQAYELPAAPIVFELDAEALHARAAAGLRAAAEAAVGVARHRHRRRPRRHPRGADGRRSTPPARALVRGATLFDIYEPPQGAAPASPTASAAWPSASSCATTSAR